jgi:hypothetical protein
MKQRIFTLLMLLTLIVVGGKAFGQTAITPYPGGTYTYTLGGIALINAGTFDVTSSSSTVTITRGAGLTGATNPYGIASSVTSAAFSIAYPTTETPGPEVITVVISDITTGCSNSILLNVTVQALPTYTLSILASQADPVCQLKGTAANQIAAAVTSGNTTVNTHTYTVTPVISNVAASGLFDYYYTITLPTNSVLGTFAITNNVVANGGTISGTAPTYTVAYTGRTARAIDVFTVTFYTTTGQADQTLTANLTTGSSADARLTVTAGGGQYTGSITSTLLDTDDLVIESMPSIGTFTW